MVTADVLREAVRRDIEALFNIERLEAQFSADRPRGPGPSPGPATLLADFPRCGKRAELRRALLLLGARASISTTTRSRATSRRVLRVFEPRLKRDSVKVRVRGGEKTGLRIDIDGVLLLSPVPERLRLSTSIDLDNGQARDRASRSADGPGLPGILRGGALAYPRAGARNSRRCIPTVARNLSLESIPCPDPYVERLLEGVAFLAARTRLKIDGEASRYVRNLLDALYPDLAGPAPAMTMAQLVPGTAGRRA